MEYTGGAIGGKTGIQLGILNILKEYTDEQHPLTQEMIEKLLLNEYGIEAKRNAIRRNIGKLREMGYDIASTRGKMTGSYLASRDFDDSELRMLIDSVLCSKYVPENYAKQLIDKLAAQSNRHFRGKLKHIFTLPEWQHQRNKEFFLNLEMIDEAISERKQLRFVYNNVGLSGKLIPQKKRAVVHPFAMVCTGGQYYLVCSLGRFDNLLHYRIDHMTGLEISDNRARSVETIPGCENGLNIGTYAREHSFMFGGKVVPVVLKMPIDKAGAVVDAFSDRARMFQLDETYMEVRINAALEGMRIFALQFGNCCEVLSPPELREQVIADIDKMKKTYEETKAPV